MREFFEGWRRKVGCTALALACWLAGVWARSIADSEVMVIDFTGTVLVSHEGYMWWWQGSTPELPFWSRGATRYIYPYFGESYTVLTGRKTGVYAFHLAQMPGALRIGKSSGRSLYCPRS